MVFYTGFGTLGGWASPVRYAGWASPVRAYGLGYGGYYGGWAAPATIAGTAWAPWGATATWW